MIIYVVLNKEATDYIITNKRVAIRLGLFSDDFKSATFKHITSVRVRQGIIAKLFNVGDITIDTSGSGSNVDFVWIYVKNPIAVKNIIEKYIDKF